MHLNLFLPFKRPSDRGEVRRVVRLSAPTWEAAPLRRVVQTACLAVFLWLFFAVCWPYGSRHHADAMAGRELIEAETFLALDPLVSVSASIAARAVVWSLVWAVVTGAVCLVFTRGFCGYLCPFGTLIDLFDWAIGKRLTRGRRIRYGWWVNIKYALLTAVLVAAAAGTLVTGFVAAIPLLTRGMLHTAGPLQLGLSKGWYIVPPMHAGYYISIALFVLVFMLSLLGPRFWCRCLCPTGALFSTLNLLRLTDRRVKPSCTKCGRCIDACPFDAIKADFTTRPADCTFCQTCGGACPVGAIEFGPRRAVALLPVPGAPAAPAVSLSRRAVLAGGIGAGGAAMGCLAGLAARSAPAGAVPVRAPGAVPEADFLRLCVRCGLCIKACPYNVLQPMGLAHGLDAMWTPHVVADWAGCHQTCTNCGQVCPTGAIRALPLDEKRVARMGLAVVNEKTCLPHAGRDECELCEKECTAAGYNAIMFNRVGVETDELGMPIEGTGYRAPLVLADKCVGCGLCQTRCRHINADQKHLIEASAIIVEAGKGKEDRLLHGSYKALREQERREKEAELKKQQGGNDFFIP